MQTTQHKELHSHPDYPTLPSPKLRRWTPLRKLAVVSAIRSGVVAKDQVKDIYNLSTEELDGWLRFNRSKELKATEKGWKI